MSTDKNQAKKDNDNQFTIETSTIEENVEAKELVSSKLEAINDGDDDNGSSQHVVTIDGYRYKVTHGGGGRNGFNTDDDDDDDDDDDNDDDTAAKTGGVEAEAAAAAAAATTTTPATPSVSSFWNKYKPYILICLTLMVLFGIIIVIAFTILILKLPTIEDEATSMLLPYIPNLQFEPTLVQQRALEWLITHDDEELLIENKEVDRLLDRYVLAIFYYATNGEFWDIDGDKDGWLSESSVCNWDFIECDGGSAGRVSELSMGNRGVFNGTIPTEFGNLSLMTKLYLWNVQLTGSIPTEIGNMSLMTGLYLHTNQLTGSIPTEIGNMSLMKGLSLHTNQLTGSIPTEIGNMSSMERLHLHTNQLTGTIPTEIINLVPLTLSLHTNQLTGKVPADLISVPYSSCNPGCKGGIGACLNYSRCACKCAVDAV